MSSQSSADMDDTQFDVQPQPEAFPKDQSGDAEQHGHVVKGPAEVEPPDRAPSSPADARRADTAAVAGIRSADVNADADSANYRPVAASALEQQHNAALPLGLAVYGSHNVDENEWSPALAAGKSAAVKAARQADGTNRSNRGLVPSPVMLQEHRPLDESREGTPSVPSPEPALPTVMASNNQGLFDSIGRYPPEYNPKVHGPYNPGRFYGKPDIAFGDVKLGDLSAWLGRRSKNPVDLFRAIARANWRWYQRWMLPRKAGVAGFVQGALALSVFHYFWQYEAKVNERHAKYHW